MKTLMHICCAPCANQPIEVLRTDGIEVAGFWYNPNIHPVTEYRARRNCLEAYAKEIELPLIMKNDYALRPFVRMVAEDIGHLSGQLPMTLPTAAANATKCGSLRLQRPLPRAASTALPPLCLFLPIRTTS